jgi:hypothetical protein
MMTLRSGIAVAVAGALAVASIVFYWLNLPEWGYCIEDGPHQGCEVGVFISNAITGTLAVLVGLATIVVGLIVAKGRRGIVVIAISAFALLLLGGWVLQLATLEEVPMPV